MRYLLLLLLPFCAQAASVSLSTGANCTFISASVDSSGNAFYSCGGVPVPNPVPLPTPTPTPPPYVPPAAGNVVMQTMCVGGSNNYVYDLQASQYRNDCHLGIGPQYLQPQGTIQSFPIPKTWRDGLPLISAGIAFTSTSYANTESDGYEVAFSKTPGDFDYYKSPAAAVNYFGQTYYPCGQISGADQSIGFAVNDSGATTCKFDSGQWYMSWRVLNCKRDTGHTCGLTFYVPRG